MRLASVKTGDIVGCDVRGQSFLAFVDRREDGLLEVEPIKRGITYRRVTARQVKHHWRKAGTR
jgi:hypothetical protein